MSEFGSVFLDGILKEIKTLNSVKNVTFKNIPTHCLKEIVDISSPILNQIWNNKIINQKSLPANQKLADITPGFEKINSNLAENYRVVK